MTYASQETPMSIIFLLVLPILAITVPVLLGLYSPWRQKQNNANECVAKQASAWYQALRDFGEPSFKFKLPPSFKDKIASVKPYIRDRHLRDLIAAVEQNADRLISRRDRMSHDELNRTVGDIQIDTELIQKRIDALVRKGVRRYWSREW